MDAEAPELAEEERLAEAWPAMEPEERVRAFQKLPRGAAGRFFLARSPRSQAILLHAAPDWERSLLLRMLAPDDAADMLQQIPADERGAFLALFDDRTRAEVSALLAYAEDEAGGLMNPRFVRVRPDSTIDAAVAYVRKQTRERAETIHYLYVLDQEQRLQGVLSFRDLLLAPVGAKVADVMRRDVVTVLEDTDQEEVARVISDHDLVAVPVLDKDGRMRGIVTVDDIVDVVREEATEDIQKIGAVQALDKPYLQTRPLEMVRKRAPWLVLLFAGQFLTAGAMGFFEEELAAAIVLAFFLPMIISSGGNSGSQATTLVVRAMALDEVRLRDWWRVIRRELSTGLVLGLILSVVGVTAVLLGEELLGRYGAHFGLVGVTVGVSVIAVVTWGTVVGSLLPFALRRFGFDPATASAPFVATLSDVSGVVIYFAVARAVLSGGAA